MDANEAGARRRLRPGVLEYYRDFHKGRLSAVHDFFLQPQAMRLLAIVGHTKESKAAAMSAGGMPADWNLQGNVAITLALAGDTAGGERIAADLNRRFPEATTVRYCYLPSVRAALALRQGRPQEAIESLVAASPYEMMPDAAMFPVYLRGEAYLAARQGAQAAAQFQKMLDHPDISFDPQLDRPIEVMILPALLLPRSL